MNHVAIVYWSGTGNTEKMAQCIAEGVQDAGGTAALLGPGDFSADNWNDYQAVAFGCPAMGAEQLEEGEFEPMFSALEGTLSGKKIALFGSYGWGDGQWMREWCQRCSAAQLYDEDGLILNESPDADGQETCRELGRGLARWYGSILTLSSLLLSPAWAPMRTPYRLGARSIWVPARAFQKFHYSHLTAPAMCGIV